MVHQIEILFVAADYKSNQEICSKNKKQNKIVKIFTLMNDGSLCACRALFSVKRIYCGKF